MAKRTIRLQPIQGKFLQTKVNNHQVNIWLVDPKTNQQGTEVAYDDAIAILSFRHPVATPALIKGKDGKFIQQLTDEDKAAIQELKDNNGEAARSGESGESSDLKLLKNLAETQGQLLQTQAQMLAEMKNEIAELKSGKTVKEKTSAKDKTDAKK